MTMRFAYGGYVHEDGECRVENPNPQNIVSEEGKLVGIKSRLVISGRKHGNTLAELTGKLMAMEAAYKIPAQTASLGGTPLTISVASPVLLTTQPPAYTGTTHGQFTHYADYTIVLEAEVVNPNNEPFFDYQETVTFNPPPMAGTNQDFVLQLPLEGVPMRQGGGTFSFEAVQVGRVSHNIFWLQPQIPAWPDHCHWKGSTVEFNTTKGATKGNFRYTTSWSYHFEAPFPLNFYPSLKLY